MNLYRLCLAFALHRLSKEEAQGLGRQGVKGLRGRDMPICFTPARRWAWPRGAVVGGWWVDDPNAQTKCNRNWTWAVWSVFV